MILDAVDHLFHTPFGVNIAEKFAKLNMFRGQVVIDRDAKIGFAILWLNIYAHLVMPYNQNA